MKLKMLVYITLLLVLSAGVVQAVEEPECLHEIGKHSVNPLESKEALCEMMQGKVWDDINEALDGANCLGIQCSELSDEIKDFFATNCTNPPKDTIDEEPYWKDSVTFHWMMFRPNGKGKIKIAKNLKWCGDKPNPLLAYEFTIDYNKRKYTFTVPKKCGNLALLKVTECPDNTCENCPGDNCPEECKPKNPCENCPGNNCPEECNKCQNCPGDNCPEECKPKNPCEDCPGDNCPEECKPKNPCENCPGNNCPEECNKCQNCPGDNCPEECKPKNPCPKNCREKCASNSYSEDCQTCKKLNCIEVPPPCPDKPCPKNCREKCASNSYSEDCQTCKKLNCIEVPPPCPDKPCPKNCREKCASNSYSEDCQTCKKLNCIEVPPPCPDKPCPKNCREKCASNSYSEDCQTCKKLNCIEVPPPCPDKPCPKNCREKCASNSYSEDCQTCKKLNCIEPPEKCPNDCRQKCKDESNGADCLKCKDLNCIQLVPSPFHFIADLGYYRQSDPADYLFGRVGIEYNLSDNASWLEGVSLLTMIGAAPKIGGSDGDSAFLLDVIAQYNWLQSSLRGFTGLGLGGWFTSGDTEDDSGDSDLDIIANIGVRILDNPNMSIFLEMRNAVDELDSISEYGRFGAGVRFQF